MCKIDIKFISDRRQSPIGSIKHGICGHVVRRSEPFAFEYAPQCFRNVQMWGIWGQEEKEQYSLFPNRPKLAYEFAPVYFSIIQYEESLFPYPERKSVKEIRDLAGRYAFSRTETLIVIVAVYYAEDAQSEDFLGRDKDILSPELPAVRHVSFRAHMALVYEVKVYAAFVCLPFEFLQLLGLMRIELRRGRALGTFSYTSISRANADKKALNVLYGVNDEGEIVWLENVQADTDFISEMIKARLDPVPEVQLIPMEHEGRALLEVKVKAGVLTPYYYQDGTAPCSSHAYSAPVGRAL